MNPEAVLRALDLGAASFVFGATVWFFFVQSPVLLQRLGRERFVPVQMRLTVVLFKALTIAVALLSIASIAHGRGGSAGTRAAVIALIAVSTNRWLVLPRALRAGGQSVAGLKNTDPHASVSAFASEGAGNLTKLWHRLVVLFVVVMLAAVVVHGALLLTA